MRHPLAAPPGRGRTWLRRVPIICLGAVYGTWLCAAIIIVVAQKGVDEDIHAGWAVVGGAMAAYGVQALLFVVLPAAIAATVLAFERDRGTMETLVLTSLDHRRLAMGRFYHAALPWLKLMLMLAPLYIVQAVAANGGFRPSRMRDFMGLSVVYLFAPKLGMITLMGEGMTGRGGCAPWVTLLMVGRFGKDLIEVLLCVAVGFYCSARFRRGLHAVLVALVMVPAAMLSVFMIAEWGFFGLMFFSRWMMRWSITPELVVSLYAAVALLQTVAQVVVIGVLVGRVARRFDSYALGYALA
jgi:hypothetical protein